MFSNDIKERDGSEHKTMTGTLFTLKHLEPCKVRVSETMTRSTRKMYTSRRVQGQLPLSGRQIQKKRQLQVNN